MLRSAAAAVLLARQPCIMEGDDAFTMHLGVLGQKELSFSERLRQARQLDALLESFSDAEDSDDEWIREAKKAPVLYMCDGNWCQAPPWDKSRDDLQAEKEKPRVDLPTEVIRPACGPKSSHHISNKLKAFLVLTRLVRLRGGRQTPSKDEETDLGADS